MTSTTKCWLWFTGIVLCVFGIGYQLGELSGLRYCDAGPDAGPVDLQFTELPFHIPSTAKACLYPDAGWCP